MRSFEVIEGKHTRDAWMNKQLPEGKTTVHYVVDIKPYCVREICGMYNITSKTFHKWIIPLKRMLGTRRGRYYTVRQVEMIFYHIGMPYSIQD